MYPISIIVYPLFGSWRAECKSCGAYANSEGKKYSSPIGEALDNLSKHPTTFSDKSKNCQHHYGAYKPRVNCYIKAKDLAAIKEPKTLVHQSKFNGEYWEPNYDGPVVRVVVSHQYHIDVINDTPVLQIVEPKSDNASNDVDALYAELEKTVTQTLLALKTDVERQAIAYRKLKYAAVCLIILILGLFLGGSIHMAGGFKSFLSRLEDGCSYKLCL